MRIYYIFFECESGEWGYGCANVPQAGIVFPFVENIEVFGLY